MTYRIFKNQHVSSFSTAFSHRLASYCWAALFWLLACGSAFAAPLAVLSDVAGQVQVIHNKKTQSGQSGTALYAGDVVRIVNGSATLFYASRAPQLLKTGAQVSIGTASATGETSGPKAQSPVWKGLYSGLTSGFARRTQTKAFAVRGSKVATAPCPLVPAGLIADEHPTLVWVAPKAAEELGVQDYEVYLFGPDDKLLWRTTTERTFVVYPNDAPPLQPKAQYVWQVVPRRLITTKTSETPQLQLDEASKSVGLWFRLAKTGEGAQAQAEAAQVSAQTEELPPHMRKLAVASALRERGLATAALTVLMPAIFAPASQPELPASPGPLVWPTFREAHAQLDDASQVFINELAAQTDVDSG